jgi:Tol biopolymer transport system component
MRGPHTYLDMYSRLIHQTIALLLSALCVASCGDSSVTGTSAVDGDIDYAALDGGTIMYREKGEYWIVSGADRSATRFALKGAAAGEKITRASLSPDGKHVAIQTNRDDNPRTDAISVVSRDGTGFVTLGSDGAAIMPTWSTDSRFVVANTHNYELETGGIDAFAIDALTAPRRLLALPKHDISSFPECPNAGLSVRSVLAVDESLAIVCEIVVAHSVKILTPSGAASGQLQTGRNQISQVSWSPDGQLLALIEHEISASSSQETGYALKLINRTGAVVRTLHSARRPPGLWSSPADVCWMPNGRRILFTVVDDYNRSIAIWSIKPDGTGLMLLTRSTSAHDVSCAR